MKTFDEWWTEQGYSNPVERSYAEESWEIAQQECAKHCLELIEAFSNTDATVNDLVIEIKKIK